MRSNVQQIGTILSSTASISESEANTSEETRITTVSCPAGRLEFFHSHWRKKTSDTLISIWGVVPLSNSYWSSEESKAFSERIKIFFDNGVVQQAKPRKNQFILRIFSVPNPDGSHRIIFNSKKLNKFMNTDHFKLEDHLVPIHKVDRKYLRFYFQDNLYEFCTLPFDCSARYVLTKIMKSVISSSRYVGFTSVIYVDDILLIEKSELKCRESVEATCQLLNKLGF